MSAATPRAAAATCRSVPASTPRAEANPARSPCAAVRVTMKIMFGPGIAMSASEARVKASIRLVIFPP